MIGVYVFAGGFALKALPAFAAFFDGARDEYDRIRWLMSRPLGTLEFMAKAAAYGQLLEFGGFLLMNLEMIQASGNMMLRMGVFD